MAKGKARAPREELKASARRVWLAGLGALAVAEEEGGKLFKSLVRRGESFESEGGKRAEALAHQLGGLRGRAGKVVDRLGDTMDDRVTRVLHRIGVPTRDEIRALTRKIEHLTATVEKTRARKPTAAARKPSPPAAPEMTPEPPKA